MVTSWLCLVCIVVTSWFCAVGISGNELTDVEFVVVVTSWLCQASISGVEFVAVFMSLL